MIFFRISDNRSIQAYEFVITNTIVVLKGGEHNPDLISKSSDPLSNLCGKKFLEKILSFLKARAPSITQLVASC